MTQQSERQARWLVVASSHSDVSPPLRELALLPVPPSREHRSRENPRIPINHIAADRPNAVNASDVSLTKSQVGQVVSGSNFREDVNSNGSINAADLALVKANAGTSLP